MGSFSAHLRVAGLIGWLGFSSVGCSCVPSTTASTNRERKDKADHTSPRHSEGIDQSQSESRDAASDANSADGERPSKGESSPTKAESGGPSGARGKAAGNPVKGGQTGSGFASIAEGLFGKPSEGKVRTSPTEAHSKATSLEQEAIDLERKGKKEEAFEKALEAWQLVRVHDQDAACCSLAQRLEPVLERLGEAANSGRYRSTGKPLRIQ